MNVKDAFVDLYWSPAARRQQPYFAPGQTAYPVGGSGLDGQRVVIELKDAPRDSERAAEITNRIPFRMARCSKYVEGIWRLRMGRG